MPSAYEALSFEKRDGIAVIRFTEPDHPGRPSRLPDDLLEVCAEIEWDEELRVLILTGAGTKSFELQPPGADDPLLADRPVLESVAGLQLPVIAALDGEVIDEALELALACDLRIAAETCRLGLTHVRKGLIPSNGGTQRLSRLVGKGKAIEMILTGEVIDAREAHRIGLIHQLVPPDQLMIRALQMANEMASKAPVALTYAKEAIHNGMDLPLEQALRLEADLYLLLQTTRDREEGIRAFREKRAPKFEGR